MEPVVAILEDNERRGAAMKACLAVALPGVSSIFFESALEMVAWLGTHQAEVILISLDFDLPIKRNEDGTLIDYGDGAIVADYLASVPPTCPIVIHSSNAVGAFRMDTTLRAAGWPTFRVYPADDLAWIDDSWIREIRKRAVEFADLHL
jgi:hypothetical protein